MCAVLEPQATAVEIAAAVADPCRPVLLVDTRTEAEYTGAAALYGSPLQHP